MRRGQQLTRAPRKTVQQCDDRAIATKISDRDRDAVGAAARQSRSCDLQRLDLGHLIGHTFLRKLKLIADLQIEPELRLDAEVPPQTQRRIGGDGPFAVHNLVNPPRRGHR